MKTVSFHNLEVGRSQDHLLLSLHSEADQIQLVPGLNLIVAPNGYGKSTFLQTLAGVIKPLKGSSDYNGETLYISEYLTFPKFIYPSEWIEFVSHCNWRDVEKPLRETIINFRVAPILNKFLGQMSQGERRKMTWLASDASHAQLLLLDEPLDGLDLLAIETARKLINKWKTESRIVVMIAHQVGEVLDLSDQVLLIKNKKFVRWEDQYSKKAKTISPADFRNQCLEFYSK